MIANHQRLSVSDWSGRVEAYQREMATWVDSFRERRKLGQVHPVHDFLFVYYRLPPARLGQWHPGIGHALEWTDTRPTWLAEKYYSVVEFEQARWLICDPQKLDEKTRQRLAFVLDLLQQTQDRRPSFSCFGLHEWAMVYRGKEVRHEATTALRLSQQEIDNVVESRPIVCTHFDAFRFFAPEAQPLNRIQPSLDRRGELEQPGCVHANMDLYKWAFKSLPWIGSDLVGDCFRLALEAREIDMRASPYDLSAYGDYPPICIETKQGRVEYESHQRRLFEAGRLIRSRLIDQLVAVLKP